MIFKMFDKLAPNSTHFTRRLVKYVPGRGCFRAVLSQNGDKFATSPTPPIVERLRVRLLLDEWLVVARACLCMVISLMIVDLRVRIGHHVNN